MAHKAAAWLPGGDFCNLQVFQFAASPRSRVEDTHPHCSLTLLLSRCPHPDLAELKAIAVPPCLSVTPTNTRLTESCANSPQKQVKQNPCSLCITSFV